MKTIWFVYPYGPVPGEKTLDFRYVRFGKELVKRGYNVVWWTANFAHGAKAFRSEGRKTIVVSENFKVELVPTTAYSSNISFGRVKFELNFAKNLSKIINKEEQPDIIMTSGTGLCTAFRPVWPYMKKKKVPVIFDIMDVHMINAYMQSHNRIIAPAVNLITRFISKMEKNFYNNVSGVCALGSNQLAIALERTGNREIPSCLVYNGIYLDQFNEQLQNIAPDSLPIKPEGWIWCVYAGSLGPSYDIETVISAAQLAKKHGDTIGFIIAGAGPQADIVRKAAEENDHITYMGSLSPNELGSVYRNCDIGLCTYAEFSTVDMPDKFYDYCASGLAIVNSLKGEVRGHIAENRLGLDYIPGDADSLYRCIKELSDLDFEQIRKNAKAVAPKFDMKTLINPLIEMIDSLTEAESR